MGFFKKAFKKAKKLVKSKAGKIVGKIGGGLLDTVGKVIPIVGVAKDLGGGILKTAKGVIKQVKDNKIVQNVSSGLKSIQADSTKITEKNANVGGALGSEPIQVTAKKENAEVKKETSNKSKTDNIAKALPLLGVAATALKLFGIF